MLLEFDGVEFRFDGKAEVSENDDGCGPSLSPREGFLAQSTAIKRTRAECLRGIRREYVRAHIFISGSRVSPQAIPLNSADQCLSGPAHSNSYRNNSPSRRPFQMAHDRRR